MKMIINNQSSVDDAIILFALYKYASNEELTEPCLVSFDIGDDPVSMIVKANKASVSIKIMDGLKGAK